VVLTGRTKSVNVNTPDIPGSGFPVLTPITGEGQHASPGVSWDAFVTKFSINAITGAPLLVYSTYLGSPQDDAGEGVALDAGGNAYVAGYTNSGNLLPTTPAPAGGFTGIYDAFVVELSPTGTYLAGTYFGGPGTTQAFSLAIDPKTSNIVIGGLTTGLTTAPGGFQSAYGLGTTDGFVASFAPGTLAPVASTYLGGSNYDQVNSVAVGADGSVYAAGFTASGNANGAGNFPTKSAIGVGSLFASQAAFVTKLNNSTSLSSLSYSSIFGPGGEDANGVTVDVNGVAYVVGATKNPNFSSSPQFTCGLNGTNGTLNAAATSGAAIQYTAVCYSNPGQTQPYLLSLTSAGAINYLDLGAITPHDAANVGGCNLNLTKNGGTFSSGNVCTGSVGSWNAVATDTDEEAYVVGQVGLIPSNGDWERFNKAGVLEAAPFAYLSVVDNGVAVNNTSRQEYVDGTWAPGSSAGGPGYSTPNINLILPLPTPNPPVPAADSVIANGSEDVSLFAIQWADNFVTPTIVTLGPVGVNTTPAPFAVVQTQNSLGVPVSCAVPVPVPNAGNFVIAALPSTGTYSITLNTGTIGSFAGTATFVCAGDNGSTTVSFSGIVTGNLVYAPSAPLTATAQVGSGVIQEFGPPAIFYPQPANNNGNNPQITIDVNTAVGSVPYVTGTSSKSANWPTTCTLTTVGGPSAASTPPNVGTSSFVVTILSACANQIAVGVYTENITITASPSGLAPALSIPFSLTITSAGVVTQTLPQFVFGPVSAATAPQQGAFTVQAPNAAALTYQAMFGPPVNGTTPLPPQYASVISGRTGTIPANGTAVVTVQVNPAATTPPLATGVYGFCYTVVSVTLVNYTPGAGCSNVYVGTGIGFVTPAGGVLNISVPAGFAPANLTQPGTITITGLNNYASSPYAVTLPTITAATFTPALPVGSAFTLVANNGSPCNTWAQANPTNTGGQQWCTYTATVDSSSLVAGTTYVGTIAFKGPAGVTGTLTVNLTATQFPQLMWVNQNLVLQPTITFTSVVNSDTTLCSNQFPFPLFDELTSTGGSVPQVVVTVTPTSSWLGVNANGINGSQGAPGSLGNTNPVNAVLANPQTIGPSGLNVCVSASNIAKPGTYVGTVTASGVGVNSPANLTVNFIVSGTGTTNVGVWRAGFLWVLDANGNTLWDGPGPGLDIQEAFAGGIAGDVPITGDWSGTGTTKAGIYRGSTGQFLLDYNDNGVFDGCLIDRCYQYMPSPTAGDVPVTGDWSGSGFSKIGLYRPSTGQWYLNLTGSGIYQAGVDLVTNYGGLAGDVPVTGDWTGSGTTKIGLFRSGYYWVLNSTGSGTYVKGQDTEFPWGGIVGDVPVVGDWNASGTTKVGVFRLGFYWVLDTLGTTPHLFVQGVSQAFPFGGISGDVPVTGKWRKP
jgi:hypothetical protein